MGSAQSCVVFDKFSLLPSPLQCLIISYVDVDDCYDIVATVNRQFRQMTLTSTAHAAQLMIVSPLIIHRTDKSSFLPTLHAVASLSVRRSVESCKQWWKQPTINLASIILSHTLQLRSLSMHASHLLLLSSQQLESIFALLPRLISLQLIDECNSSMIQAVSNTCSRTLTEIDLSLATIPDLNANFANILTPLLSNNLIVLRLPSSKSEWYIDQSENNLLVSGENDMYERMAEIMHKSNKRILIDLSTSNYINGRGLMAIAEHMHNLTRLNMSTSLFLDVNASEYLERFRCLKHLALPSAISHHQTTGAPRWISIDYPYSNRINLATSEFYSARISTVISRLPGLRSLVLHVVDVDNDMNCLMPSSQCKQLRFFQFVRFRGDDSAAIARLRVLFGDLFSVPSLWPSLHTLNISGDWINAT